MQQILHIYNTTGFFHVDLHTSVEVTTQTLQRTSIFNKQADILNSAINIMNKK